MPADESLAIRREHSLPLLVDLESWMRTERARLSRHADTAKAMDYMLTKWDAFVRFTTDGRICLSNNAAERALRASPSAGARGPSPARSAAPIVVPSC